MRFVRFLLSGCVMTGHQALLAGFIGVGGTDAGVVARRGSCIFKRSFAGERPAQAAELQQL